MTTKSKKFWHTGNHDGILKMMQDGHTITEIAETYTVTRQSVRAYVNNCPDLAALKKDKRQAAALAFKRARTIKKKKKPIAESIPVNGNLSDAVQQFIAANGLRKFKPGESGDFDYMKYFMESRGYRIFGELGHKMKLVPPRGRPSKVTRSQFIETVDRIRQEEGLAPIVLRNSIVVEGQRSA